MHCKVLLDSNRNSAIYINYYYYYYVIGFKYSSTSACDSDVAVFT